MEDWFEKSNDSWEGFGDAQDEFDNREESSEWGSSEETEAWERNITPWESGGRKKGEKFRVPRIPVKLIVMCLLFIGLGTVLWCCRYEISSFLYMLLQWVLILAVIIIVLKLLFRPKRRRRW